MKNTLSTPVEHIILPVNQHAAFSKIVEAHRIRLYRFILKNVRNSDDAADLAQQTVLEAFRSLDNFRGESSLSTWLYGIAINLVRAYILRAPHKMHHFESEDILADMPGDTRDPNSQVSMNETLSAVQKHLNALPAEMRTVLEMVTVDEMSYEETAQHLHIPIGTVRSRVCRARIQLKSALLSAGVDAL